MSRCNAAFNIGGAGREAERGLGNVTRRVGQQRFAKVFNFSLRCRWPHQHAVAARAMHFLDHQVLQVGQGVPQVFTVAAEVGWHVVEEGFFAEVELDHFRHVGINRLVIGHAGSDGVAQRDVAAAINIEQARAAQGGGGPKSQRVEIVIVHAAVNHIDASGAAGSAHIDKVVLDKQVLPLDQLHTHLLRQEGVFKVGRVVHAGGEHHNGGIGGGGRRHGAQGFQQQVRVMRHRGHAVLAEELGKQPHHHLAVFQHVADSAGNAQVVFKHVVLALALRIGRANDVDAADVRVNVARHVHIHHLGPELRVLENLLRRNHTRLDDLLPVINIVNEAVERGDALHQATLHAGPFMRRNDAGNQVKRNQPLGTAIFIAPDCVFDTVHGKGDSDPAENHFRLSPARLHPLGRLPGQPALIALVVRTDAGRRGIHLIKHRAAHGFDLRRGCSKRVA